MTNKNIKTSKTSKSNQTQAMANEEPHTTASVAEPRKVQKSECL